MVIIWNDTQPLWMGLSAPSAPPRKLWIIAALSGVDSPPWQQKVRGSERHSGSSCLFLRLMIFLLTVLVVNSFVLISRGTAKDLKSRLGAKQSKEQNFPPPPPQLLTQNISKQLTPPRCNVTAYAYSSSFRCYFYSV